MQHRHQAIDALLARYLQPIASRLFPVEGRRLDRHHSFVVQYQPGKDTHLDMHTDDADVTFNVCLGRDFEASGLTFCGGIGTPGHRKHTLQCKDLGTCTPNPASPSPPRWRRRLGNLDKLPPLPCLVAPVGCDVTVL